MIPSGREFLNKPVQPTRMSRFCPETSLDAVTDANSDDMGQFSHDLAEVPAIVIIAVAVGSALAPLTREILLATLAWLALRGTRPHERPEILRALVAVTGSSPDRQRLRRRCTRATQRQH